MASYNVTSFLILVLDFGSPSVDADCRSSAHHFFCSSSDKRPFRSYLLSFFFFLLVCCWPRRRCLWTLDSLSLQIILKMLFFDFLFKYKNTDLEARLKKGGCRCLSSYLHIFSILFRQLSFYVAVISFNSAQVECMFQARGRTEQRVVCFSPLRA